jgi:repressor LexA
MFGEALKRLRDRDGITQAMLANKFGISQSTVGMWESGRNLPEYRTLMKLAEYFSVPIGDLTGEPSKKKFISTRIPVLGSVPAGIPIEAIEDIIDYEEITQSLSETGEFFGLRVKGTSMEPKISERDVVIVRRQDSAETGDIVVAMINGNEATLKRLKKSADGIILYPSNPEYDPMFFTNKQITDLPVRILGKVIELRAKFE